CIWKAASCSMAERPWSSVSSTISPERAELHAIVQESVLALYRQVLEPQGIGQRGSVQHFAGGQRHPLEDMPDLAGCLIAAIFAFAIGGLGEARQGGDRPVDKAQHFPEHDLLGRPQQFIATR